MPRDDGGPAQEDEVDLFDISFDEYADIVEMPLRVQRGYLVRLVVPEEEPAARAPEVEK